MDYTNDNELPEVTDEALKEALQETRAYTIAVLKAGPGFRALGADRDAEVADTIWAHGKRNAAFAPPVSYPSCALLRTEAA
jgi:hypothetical protein